MSKFLPQEEFRRRRTTIISALASLACALITIRAVIPEDEDASTISKCKQGQCHPPLFKSLCASDTPLTRLYNLYTLIHTCQYAALSHAVSHLFKHSTWKIVDLPDPSDPEPERYAVLALIVRLLVYAFNYRIKRGEWRGGRPSELHMTWRSAVWKCEYLQGLEEYPSWVGVVERDVGVVVGKGVEELRALFVG